MEYTIPGGNDKGKTLAEAGSQTLEYWAKRIEDNLVKGTSRYPDKDRALATAMRQELNYRAESGDGPARSSSPPPSAAPPSENAIAIREKVEHLTGSYTEPSELTKQLKAASEVANLVTPQTTCGQMPEGCIVALSSVLIDKEAETYGVGGGKVALDRTALSKISSAAGVSWDPILTCRLDNGAHPYYVHFRAVGRVRDFDGTERIIKGEVELDLRDGSTWAESLLATDKGPEAGKKALAQARQFILRSAETKAMNRAIREGLSVRSSYRPDDLNKPFVVARLMFTGATSDPELKHMFASKMADSFLGGRAALYGGTPPPQPQLTGGHEPPPVDQAREYDDYDDVPDGEIVEEPAKKPEAPAEPEQSELPREPKNFTEG